MYPLIELELVPGVHGDVFIDRRRVPKLKWESWNAQNVLDVLNAASAVTLANFTEYDGFKTLYR